MSRAETPITADGDYKIGTAGRGTEMPEYLSTVSFYGNFDGGTITLKYSVDGGATLIPATDVSDTVATFTADGGKRMSLGFAGINGEEAEIYATMAGATSPVVTAVVLSNK